MFRKTLFDLIDEEIEYPSFEYPSFEDFLKFESNYGAMSLAIGLTDNKIIITSFIFNFNLFWFEKGGWIEKTVALPDEITEWMNTNQNDSIYDSISIKEQILTIKNFGADR